MKKLFITIFLLTCSLFAQDWDGGFRIDFVGIDRNISGSNNFLFKAIPSSFHLTAGYDLSNSFKTEVRAGYCGVANYRGMEAGLYLHYLMLKDLYLLSGLNIHANINDPTPGYYPTTFYLFCIGSGYKITKYTSIEIEYSVPLDDDKLSFKMAGYKTPLFVNGEKVVADRLTGILKIGVGFNWSF
ncbi:MAG: hypothetical protein C4539_19955 [Ignavibacteriales bacterium]|nr:MAG: hypothetical protein C4539_19955 [Ignavibacteriales bacterium]